jgi:hypothetical protein
LIFLLLLKHKLFVKLETTKGGGMKKMNENGFHIWIIALIIVVVAALGFGGWYVWDKNKDDAGSTDGTIATVTPTPTATPTPTPATVDYLATLRTFCENYSPGSEVGGVQLVDNSYGTFGSCGISDPEGGGGMLISTYTDGAWAEVWSGNGIMDASLCTEYQLPSSIYADCPGFYE